MLIKTEQLASRLKQNHLPLVWISGEDPLLMQEACDTVRQYARENGIIEREVLDAGKDFDWNLLLASGNELSLFADRKLIDLRINTAKLEENARTALMAYLANPNPDNLLLMTTGKVDKPSQATKWFKALETQSLFCQVWPISEKDLPDWIRQRLQRMGMDADPEALQILADKVEGNLLAAVQEMEKLRIVSNGSRLSMEIVLSAVSDSSRFNGYVLVDACLAGNSERALKILQHLQVEGEACLSLLSTMCREIRNLSAMLDDIAKGQNIHGVLQNHRVWSNRKDCVTNALQTHDQGTLLRLLGLARKVDQSVKGLLNLKPWDEMASLVLGLSNPRLLVRVV